MGGAIFDQGTLALRWVTLNGNEALGGNSNATSAGLGGGGIGQDVPAGENGGGFGGPAPGAVGGSGGSGSTGSTTASGGGGGGGFNAGDDGGDGTAATGTLSGTTLGLVRLGMTRGQARHVYTRSSTRGFTARYAVGGIRAGATLAAADQRLPHGYLFRVGLNYWYLAPTAGATAVLKVRHNLVEEIGIADERLTRTHNADRELMTSFD
jgi:hypothetical protein